MPELPEVQTIVSDLNKKIVGYTIVDFWSDWPKAIKNLSLEKFNLILLADSRAKKLAIFTTLINSLLFNS